MTTFQKYYPWLLILASIFMLLTLIAPYYSYSEDELLHHALLVIALYSISLAEIYRIGKHRHVASMTKHIVVLTVAILIYTTIPVFFAKYSGLMRDNISYGYIILSNMVFTFCILGIYYTSKLISNRLSKLLLFLAINAVFFINLLSTSILYSTGFEFDTTVLLHIDPTSVKVAIVDYGVALVIIAVLTVPISIFFIRLASKHHHPPRSYGIATLVLLTLTVNSMAVSFNHLTAIKTVPAVSIYLSTLEFFSNSYNTHKKKLASIAFNDTEKTFLEKNGIQTSKTDFKPKVKNRPSNRLNLITIYLESFNQNFTETGGGIYKGLTPNLDRIATEWTSFNNFYASVTPTINAMITSQCGVDSYLDVASNEDTRDSNLVLGEAVPEEEFYGNKISCLSDYLRQANYYQVLMKSAYIEFSNKGKFFRAHSYDETIGQQQLNIDHKYDGKMNTWGPHDTDLFPEALAKLEELRNRDKPYSFTLLTINSHSPGYEAPECPIYKEGNTLLNGIHCSDFAVGKFINALKERKILDDTVVILVGDHTMFLNQINLSMLDKQTLNSWYGKVFLAIHSPKANLQQYKDVFGITPDLAPTIMGLLDVKQTPFVNGKSLLGERQKYQHIITPTYEIYQGRMTPEKIKQAWNPCNDNNSIAKADLSNATFPLTDCQRAKYFSAIQKHVYR